MHFYAVISVVFFYAVISVVFFLDACSFSTIRV